MIRLEEITPDNWREELKVAQSQKDFVSNDMSLLARAYAYRNDRSRALFIYNDDLPIGIGTIL
ncbi:diamine N-acetyltransferase [Hathewaya proteolytica DSM 3090]|uniref:Diamine N-acetyltransferase n=1 Tax=Hathewaya proteolytica DSM 3090 TaxID=1121331 RepID=A0A1M6KHI2_9CLOT|nr:hypothetical protein [Hathewaya proteolytica]SHJ58443.1 diamine N-acetyltransferase [Hathewaya proteolytica DSM 3090]